MRKKVAKKQKGEEMHPKAKIIKIYVYLTLLGATLATALIIQRNEVVRLFYR